MDTESRTNPASLFLAREAVFMEMNIEAEIRERDLISKRCSRRLLLSCASDNSDDLVSHLDSSCSIEEQKQATMEIRLLSKNKPENASKSPKPKGVTAIVNLSLCDENKDLIASSGAKPLVRVLKMGTPTAKVNAACALLRLSQVEDNKVAIRRSGVIPLLVNLVETGGFRAKKNASTALYSLCSAKENKLRAVQSGIMKPLVDKSAFVMGLLMSVPESKPVILVEEFRFEESVVYRTMVAREGAIPPLPRSVSSNGGRSSQL
uniref:Armadillo repeat-containing domain-containing protein n=1 Tax=Brassica oleracea TaxID=3712 RepID=A0A3P6FB69_BRAOL|nr:unnamed protein product [Brassica oleracea]